MESVGREIVLWLFSSLLRDMVLCYVFMIELSIYSDSLKLFGVIRRNKAMLINLLTRTINVQSVDYLHGL